MLNSAGAKALLNHPNKILLADKLVLTARIILCTVIFDSFMLSTTQALLAINLTIVMFLVLDKGVLPCLFWQTPRIIGGCQRGWVLGKLAVEEHQGEAPRFIADNQLIHERGFQRVRQDFKTESYVRCHPSLKDN